MFVHIHTAIWKGPLPHYTNKSWGTQQCSDPGPMLTSQSHRKDSETGVGFLYFQGVDHLFLNMANPTTTKKTPHFTVPYRWCLRLKKCVQMLHIGFAKIPRNLWNYPQYWPSFPSSLGLAPQNPKSSEQFPHKNIAIRMGSPIQVLYPHCGWSKISTISLVSCGCLRHS